MTPEPINISIYITIFTNKIEHSENLSKKDATLKNIWLLRNSWFFTAFNFQPMIRRLFKNVYFGTCSRCIERSIKILIKSLNIFIKLHCILTEIFVSLTADPLFNLNYLLHSRQHMYNIISTRMSSLIQLVNETIQYIDCT